MPNGGTKEGVRAERICGRVAYQWQATTIAQGATAHRSDRVDPVQRLTLQWKVDWDPVLLRRLANRS
ncbi:MAG: hypothetical protein J2P41_01260 [Blastocatellia bacterium]|nr:hypothetical protein [Blastocatellia bacterium]